MQGALDTFQYSPQCDNVLSLCLYIYIIPLKEIEASVCFSTKRKKVEGIAALLRASARERSRCFILLSHVFVDHLCAHDQWRSVFIVL